MRPSSIEHKIPWFCLACGVALWLAPAVGRAASEPDPEALVQSGLQARKEQRDADALQDFLRAYQAAPSPRVLAHIGLAEQAVGQWVAAEEHLLAALRFSEDAWIARHRRALEESVDVVGGWLASLEVVSNAQGGEVWLNEVRLGPRPVPVQRVLAGRTVIELRGDGFEPLHQVVALDARKTHTVTLLVMPSAADHAQANPGAAPTPFAHAREASDASSSGPPSVYRTLAWMLLVSGGVLLATAITAHVVREESLAVYNDDSRCLFGSLSRQQRCGSYLGDAQTSGVLAVAAYAGAGLLFGASAYCFIVSTPPALHPAAGGARPQGLGIGYRVRF